MTGNEIVKAALLGTDKYLPIVTADAPETMRKVMLQPGDKEDRFLKLAITTLLYEEAGRKPIAIENTLPECTTETLSYANDKLCQNVALALSAKNDVLFWYFTHIIAKQNLVLPSAMAPAVLNKATAQKSTAKKLVSICGEAGKWLCSINNNWRGLLETAEDESIWDTGTLDQRKHYLRAMRKSDPAKAIELLNSTIDQENAANRAALAEVLQENLSLNDEPFLRTLLSDKSQKVKETALSLLQKIEGSAINNRYLDYLTTVLSVKEERFLIVSKRKVLSIRSDVAPDETFFNTGIGKVSSDKGVPDHLYIVGQVLRFINPTLLASRLAVTDDELINLFLKHADVAALYPYLAGAAATFKNKAWAVALLGIKETQYIVLLNVLSKKEQAGYYDLFLTSKTQELLNFLLDEHYSLLQPSVANALIDHLSKNPYLVVPAVYQRIALQLPNEILPQLRKYVDNPGTDYQARYFKSQAQEMIRIIDIRNNSN